MMHLSMRFQCAVFFGAFLTLFLDVARAEDLSGSSQDPVRRVIFAECPTKPAPGFPAPEGGGGGMAGDGWDGPGAGPAILAWHVENATNDYCSGQRQALLDAMQAWASVVRITFVELPVANRDRAIDWSFQVGNHCDAEPDECGDNSCPFDGGGGTLAHAGFPPGVASQCVNPMEETWAGNVHFDDAELWEQDTGNITAFSMTLVGVHELGHALGLTHSNNPNDVMRAAFNSGDGFNGLSANDIANIQAGYQSGTGSVLTLNDTGVWVDSAGGGFDIGTESSPFDTVAEGVNGVPPLSEGVVLHIEAGTYCESLTISQNMILKAENGTVLIGN